MGKITKLSNNLINLIAAGEVVERPASVLKELMENSIDAKSTQIVVELVDYGIESIKITDNGEGIDREDLPLVFEQHATSKISSENDLEAILSLGFRGEAIASISSVADSVEIITKSSSHTGHSAEFRNQEIKINQFIKPEQGTSIEVKNIFKNVPARKKYLKSPNTELRHIIDTFLYTAIPFLNVHFELHHNGKELYKLTRSDDMKNRIFEIYGKEVARNLIYGSVDLGDIKITGYVGNSNLGKKNNKNQLMFINGRYVKSGLVSSAVKNGYTGHIHRDLHPTYFLFIDLDPAQADINVHPRKLEVKFTDERKIFGAVSKFVSKALEDDSKSSFGMQSSSPNEPVDNIDAADTKPFFKPKYNNSSVGRGFSTNNDKRAIAPKPQRISDAMRFTKSLFDTSPMEMTVEENRTDYSTELNVNPKQIFETYIVYEDGGKFVFIDQHAAAEKIAFEKLINQFGQVQTKPLLIPEIIDLKDVAEKNGMIEQKEDFEKMGFIIGDFGDRSIQIVEVPEIANISDFDTLMDDFSKNESELGIKVSGEFLEKYNVSKDVYLKIATVACHGSIRAGQKLSEMEMKQIIKDVQKIQGSLNCPHGRPILWELSKSQIEKNFNRDI